MEFQRELCDEMDYIQLEYLNFIWIFSKAAELDAEL